MRRHSIKIVFAFIAAVYILVSMNINFGKNKWQDVLESDAWGYYAYLPAIFIYHDLNFNFNDKVMHGGHFNERLAYEYRILHNNRLGNKYFCGTALLISPFFVGAHYLSKLNHHPLDGYSRSYILAVNMAAVFYALAGLYFLFLLLNYYTSNLRVKIICLLAIAFGTQVFYYSFAEPGMSHVYSFFTINLFLWGVKSFFDSYQKKYLFIASLALGIVFLIRPFNLIILLSIPFLAGSYIKFIDGLQQVWVNKKVSAIAFLLFLSVALIQAIIYYLQMKLWWVDSYPGEHFNFLKPNMLNALFSFRKGLFIYTPLILLAHAGLFFIFRNNKWLFFTYLFFFFVLTYLLSSWWMWYYGGGFSLRPFIDYFGLFAVLLAVFLDQTKYRNFTLGIIFILVVWCQIQTYQYRYFVIHWSDMNKDMYFDAVQKIPDLF